MGERERGKTCRKSSQVGLEPWTTASRQVYVHLLYPLNQPVHPRLVFSTRPGHQVKHHFDGEKKKSYTSINTLQCHSVAFTDSVMWPLNLTKAETSSVCVSICETLYALRYLGMQRLTYLTVNRALKRHC